MLIELLAAYGGFKLLFGGVRVQPTIEELKEQANNGDIEAKFDLLDRGVTDF